MKALGNVTPVFGNGAGAAFSAAPTLADLKPRFKNEFGTPFAAILAAAGFTKVTGMPGVNAIDWDNITYDPSIAIGQQPVTVGHEYYRFDDADQAGHPVFLVIRHRIARTGSAGTATVYMMFPTIIVCHGLDGAGNPLQVGTTMNTYPSRGSGDAGYAVNADVPVQIAACTQPGFMSLRGNPLTNVTSDPVIPLPFHFLVERLRDATGAPQSVDRGVIFITSAYDGQNSLTSKVGISSLDSSSVAATQISSGSGNMPLSAPYTYIAGTVSPIYPVAFLAPRPRSSRNWCAGAGSDWPIGSEATIPVPGGLTGNFRSVGRLGNGFIPTTSSAILVRWE